MSTTTHHLMTADELFWLDDGLRHELVKGELLTMSPSGARHGALVGRLTGPLSTYVKANDLGEVFGAETGFKLESDPDTVLAPDIAFISKHRISDLPTTFLNMSPDLVVEVISPSERKSKLKRKTSQWLSFGAKLVWLVKPKNKTIEVHRVSNLKVLTLEDVLSGDEVVPGFEIAVTRIFE